MELDSINNSNKSIFNNIVERFFKYLMITPLTLILLAVAIFPFLFALRLSFTDATTVNIMNPNFVGLQNYIEIFTSMNFWHSVFITFIYVTIALTLEIIIGLGLALLVDEISKWDNIISTSLITPMLISTVLVGIMFRMELNPSFGIIPHLLKLIGINIELLSKNYALMTVLLIDVWQWTGFIFIIALAGLKALPVEPFEAGKVFGASTWQKLKYITLPLVKPVLMIGILFRLMDAFKAFDHIYILTSGGPGEATTTISLLVYNMAYKLDDFGRASAVAIVLLILIILITKYLLRYVPFGKNLADEA